MVDDLSACHFAARMLAIISSAPTATVCNSVDAGGSVSFVMIDGA